MQLGALGRVSREFKGKGLQGQQRVYTVREQSGGRGKGLNVEGRVSREREGSTGRGDNLQGEGRLTGRENSLQEPSHY